MIEVLPLVLCVLWNHNNVCVVLQPLVVRRTCCPVRTPKPQRREQQRPRNTTWRWKITSPFLMMAWGEDLSHVHTLWMNNVFFLLPKCWMDGDVFKYVVAQAWWLPNAAEPIAARERPLVSMGPSWSEEELGRAGIIHINPGSCLMHLYKCYHCTHSSMRTFSCRTSLQHIMFKAPCWRCLLQLCSYLC